MDCNVIKDLIPLYIDGCCSEESATLVRTHIENCKDCRALYELLRTPCDLALETPVSKSFGKINEWKASVLQSASLFLSFAIIVVGVSLEAATPVGSDNGLWALSLIIPATGFMLSLANWFFVRLYRTRKCFSNSSAFATIAIIVCGYVWGVCHYGLLLTELMSEGISYYGIGALLSTILVIGSMALSNQYASLLGKE
jgi:hypothetical protein